MGWAGSSSSRAMLTCCSAAGEGAAPAASPRARPGGGGLTIRLPARAGTRVGQGYLNKSRDVNMNLGTGTRKREQQHHTKGIPNYTTEKKSTKHGTNAKIKYKIKSQIITPKTKCQVSFVDKTTMKCRAVPTCSACLFTGPMSRPRRRTGWGTCPCAGRTACDAPHGTGPPG